MWRMPIVAVEPVEQLGGSLMRVLIGEGVGPFAKPGLNEAFCFPPTGGARRCVEAIEREYRAKAFHVS